MYISMCNIISSRVFDEKLNTWRDMKKTEETKALEKIKNFLLSTCRSGSQVANTINRMSINNLPKYAGILERLTTDGYIAGQDYPSELRFVKNWIKKYC